MVMIQILKSNRVGRRKKFPGFKCPQKTIVLLTFFPDFELCTVWGLFYISAI